LAAYGNLQWLHRTNYRRLSFIIFTSFPLLFLIIILADCSAVISHIICELMAASPVPIIAKPGGFLLPERYAAFYVLNCLRTIEPNSRFCSVWWHSEHYFSNHSFIYDYYIFVLVAFAKIDLLILLRATRALLLFPDYQNIYKGGRQNDYYVTFLNSGY